MLESGILNKVGLILLSDKDRIFCNESLEVLFMLTSYSQSLSLYFHFPASLENTMITEEGAVNVQVIWIFIKQEICSPIQKFCNLYEFRSIII